MMFHRMLSLQVMLAALASILISASPASATSFNLSADWSDSSNPNGVWSYNSGGVPLPSTVRASDPWGTPQQSWGDLPGWFRSNGSELFGHDWLAGDVVTHTGSSEITWTSPSNGSASVSGGAWAARDIGRYNAWEIYLDSVLLTSGVIGSGDPYSRATPFDFSTGSGGPAVLMNIPINVGDIIELRLTPLGTGDYAGVNLSIDTTAATTVPEPASLGLTAFALGLLSLARRRRAKSDIRSTPRRPS